MTRAFQLSEKNPRASPKRFGVRIFTPGSAVSSISMVPPQNRL